MTYYWTEIPTIYVFVTDKTITIVSFSNYNIFTLPLSLGNCWRRESVERCADNTCLLTVDSTREGVPQCCRLPLTASTSWIVGGTNNAKNTCWHFFGFVFVFATRYFPLINRVIISFSVTMRQLAGRLQPVCKTPDIWQCSVVYCSVKFCSEFFSVHNTHNAMKSGFPI